MFGFFKRKKQYPPFDWLAASDLKNKYFVRAAEWDLLTQDSIYVFDPTCTGMVTLSNWLETVFLAAKGQTTIQEFVYYVADKYDSGIPQILDKIILDQIQTLLGYHFIRLANSKQQLDPLYELPKCRRSTGG